MLLPETRILRPNAESRQQTFAERKPGRKCMHCDRPAIQAAVLMRFAGSGSFGSARARYVEVYDIRGTFWGLY